MHLQSEALVWIIILGTAALFMVAIFFYLLFGQFLKRKANHIKEVEALKYQFQQAIYATQIEIQEQTFKKIGLELHDNIGQMLSLISLQINELATSDEALKANIIQYLTHSISDLRSLSQNLNFTRLKETDIYTFIENEVAGINKSKYIHASLQCEKLEGELDNEMKLIVFRLVQEALQNIVKHAKANEIIIKLYLANALLKININDNGVGFDIDDASKINGQGLKNLKHRTEVLRGKFNIYSTINSGTTVTFEIPIVKL